MISLATDPALPAHRLQLRIKGAVQGVGFRPFVYHLAQSLGLRGWIRNTHQGVFIEVEGSSPQLEQFQARLQQEKPAHADLQKIEVTWSDVIGYQDFAILSSEEPTSPQATSALILPDLATCPACLADLFDPQNRHYRYPFTNCTHCGPRFSILRSLPYDRAHTTLQTFSLCPACRLEYDNPSDRRFHAQPNACPRCGPHLELWDSSGQVLASHDQALQQAGTALRAGEILALKGLGGFHLIVDARNNPAVERLRNRKHRPDKPLAVMFPSLDQIREYCHVSDLAAQLLQSAAAPILLLPIQNPSLTAPLAAAIAPGNPYLGGMLPYTPLHHLLLAELSFPVVATSGNRAGVPICIDEIQALKTLEGIADVFLVHNRPIARPIDDSMVQVVNGQGILLRRARGYAPFPITLAKGLADPSPEVILAVGGHLKNTVALYVHQQLFVSQHLGDLDQAPTRDRFQETIQQLCNLYQTTPTVIACDAHPDYYSTQFAHTLATSPHPLSSTRPHLIAVQHHYAHVLSCLADNQWHPPVLGVAWDGTGYGLDGTIWGGECLWLPGEAVPEPGFIRAAHLRTFPLLGGEQAVKAPRRCALGLLYECLGEAAFERLDLAVLQSFLPAELAIFKTMLQRGLNTPRTSSMGRLFDAIAALLGFCPQSSFEGQAAMQLEFAIAGHRTDATYPYQVEQQANTSAERRREPSLQFDPAPMVKAILQDLQNQVPPGIIAATFHNTLVAGLVEVACRLRITYPEITQIVLTGGCFQNQYLLERAIEHLQKQDFLVGCHHQLPSNDGGIAAGQIMAALRFFKHPLTTIKDHERSQPRCA
ncbi:carbamoyltransferase HypF [Neosynechococcus sphagnicola]|uniref:carbamoyltransferase HypF n=1 Tax=Neosynechococcus sphagnicola TaxID=1501145 RepID=UPI000907B861|nr:carbamoyltransferase HypF [Neosynechococcus sphagnicola]